MDNWEKFLYNWLENSKQEFDTFCLQVGKDWEKNASEIEENLNTFILDIENTVSEELTQFVNEIDILIDDFFSLIIDDDFRNRVNQDRDNNRSNYSDYIGWFEDQKIEPNSQFHSACINCANYHGRVYGGNLLICGMHPYGWNDENCPDWEADNK